MKKAKVLNFPEQIKKIEDIKARLKHSIKTCDDHMIISSALGDIPTYSYQQGAKFMCETVLDYLENS